VDWNSARAKLIVAGPILIVLGLVLYVAKGITAVLVFPVIGARAIANCRSYLGVKPRQRKQENLTSGAP
jgi:hypothetical protein